MLVWLLLSSAISLSHFSKKWLLFRLDYSYTSTIPSAVNNCFSHSLLFYIFQNFCAFHSFYSFGDFRKLPQNVPHVWENGDITFGNSAISVFSEINQYSASFYLMTCIEASPNSHFSTIVFHNFLQFSQIVHVQLPQLVLFQQNSTFCSFPFFPNKIGNSAPFNYMRFKPSRQQ